MNHLERFRAVMEYETVDRCPNWEVGVWAQSQQRWAEEGLDIASLHWDWFSGEESLGMDPNIPLRMMTYLGVLFLSLFWVRYIANNNQLKEVDAWTA